MIDKNPLRSELLQITVVTLSLLAIGMISWVGRVQKIQNLPVGRPPNRRIIRSMGFAGRSWK